MRMEFLTTRRWSRSVVVLLLAVILTACGADDGEDEPTATSAPEGAQPTVAVEESTPDSPAADLVAESTPTNTDMSSVPANVVEESEDATPMSAVSEVATPAAEQEPVVSVASPATGAVGTPVATGASATPAPSGADEALPGETEGNPVVGDGTTGASLGGAEVATPAVAGANPVGLPVVGTPAAQVTVTGCEVVTVPAFTGGQTTYALTTDVNFRTGPGTDCDLALETPLGEFQQVVVIGGPVSREGEDSEWVQISVLGTEGWIAFDLLEPVP